MIDTDHLILIPAGSAFSRFRREQLCERWRAIAPDLADIDAAWQFAVHLERPIDAARHAQLCTVLRGDDPVHELPGKDAVDIGPRPGTVSPWSSKATDIVQRCGLVEVRRVERLRRVVLRGPDAEGHVRLRPFLYDRMTETVLGEHDLPRLFEATRPRPLVTVPLGDDPRAALAAANQALGLALSAAELDYLANAFAALGRDPTDTELVMFAQANSEHCRHKIFNASWQVDGDPQPESLFDMIRHTTARSPTGVVSAYSDNAAVLAGPEAERWFADPDGVYRWHAEPVDIAIKVETHNHPTAISPFPGAATGAGGEIRDEGATGLGAQPKAGLCGFSVSDLHVPGFSQPWEQDIGRPERIVGALDIMLEGPIGAAAFNNEFGRPNLGGYFRTFQAPARDGRHWGYHKPIMIAGGLGNVRRPHALKVDVPAGALLVVLGGPGMLIGLGGGAASSMASGAGDAELDFASVQRGNPEMQRRAQEVINACWARGDDNPILLIHDVGAGGLSNAVPEAVDHSARGGRFDLRRIPVDEPGMSPMEIWCNESQERYVLLIAPESRDTFAALAERERCPWAILGALTDDGTLTVTDASTPGDNHPVDLPMSVLLGKTPRLARDVERTAQPTAHFDTRSLDLSELWRRVLAAPAVAGKHFLVHIADRSVGGLVARDPLVGPWQVPVSDVAVTLATHRGVAGEAMAMGERTPVACESPAAAARLAVVEALTNVLAADVAQLGDVKLSANWMAAAGQPGQDAALFDAVAAVGRELCPALGIAVPVGKDSMSMHTRWTAPGGEARSVTAPVSLVTTAFAPVADVRRTLSPALQPVEASQLVLFDLGAGREALGRSTLAQVYAEQGGEAADCAPAGTVRAVLELLLALRANDQLLAWHDVSDGGVFVTLAEMLFAGRRGMQVAVPADRGCPVAWLFGEAPAVVVQVADAQLSAVHAAAAAKGLGERVRTIATVTDSASLVVRDGADILLDVPRRDLELAWSELSFRMQALRDNPETAAEWFERIADDQDPGLSPLVPFDPTVDPAAPAIARGVRPRAAILREQGVNSQLEMAAAFELAGFEPVDVHMSDLESGRRTLDDVRVLAACGGFSYGDVLGAGSGWARSILHVPALRDAFARWFDRNDTLTLGVCNGCQMLAQLRALIPGTDDWPTFLPNRSAQFEGRLSQVLLARPPGPWFDGMQGARLPVVVSHGEGRATFADAATARRCAEAGLVAAQYAEGDGRIAQRYPANPNGSTDGIAMLTSADGRVAISMPHPERTLRTVQHSWCPADWPEPGPWARLFRNVRAALD